MDPGKQDMRPDSATPTFQRTYNNSAVDTRKEYYHPKPALPRRPDQNMMLGVDERLSDELNGLHRALKDSRADNTKYKDLLHQSQEREQELNQALDEEVASKEEFRNLWKQNAADLNAHLVNDRGFKPLDDKVFIDKVSLLRRDIRDFAYQYFGSWPPDIKPSSQSIKEVTKMLELESSSIFRMFALSSVIRAYMWIFLAKKVFNRFVWAEHSEAIYELTEFLRPMELPHSAEEREGRRQFELWKARTSTLLQTTKGTWDDKKRNMTQGKNIDQLINTLAGLVPNGVRKKELSEAVNMIWADAVGLDMVMNTQPSGLDLYYGRDIQSPMQIQDDLMEIEPDRAELASGSSVSLVLEPALRRTGDHDGNFLAQRVILLKMLVSCDTEEVQSRGIDKRRNKQAQEIRRGLEVFWDLLN
ncbi:hypothetical protein ACHAPY_011633 [Fusarium culmorum]